MQRLTYTVTETARILGISRTTAYECVRRGEIPSLTLGRRVVITHTALEQLLGALPHTGRTEQPGTPSGESGSATPA
jgi:excisionase family DNA binding protein